MNSIYCCWLFFVCCSCRIILPMNPNSKIVKRENQVMKMYFRNEPIPNNLARTNSVEEIANISKIRKKRNSGAGKFVEAAQMPQIKLVRLFLQMFKNLWDSAYVGGSHPFHPNVPKIVVQLYKQKIVEFFIPDIGEESKGN